MNLTHKGTVELKTKRLLLRRFTMDDANSIFNNWANDPDVTEYLTWQPHGNIDVTKTVLTGWVDGYAKEDFYVWGIVISTTNELIGSISVVSQDDKIKMVHIGYCIGKKWWRQGFVSEALAALIKFFFEEVGINRIEARYDPQNPNSGKVMEKCGMKYEGLMRQADWNAKGICDSIIYAILAKDYYSK